MAEEFMRENARAFIRILGEAAFDYAKNRKSMSPQEWLNVYLAEKLTSKNTDEIQQNVQTMMDTICQQNTERIAMEEYLASGKSAESWFLKKMNESGLSAGEQAKNMTELLLALQKSEANIENIPESQWNDANWNRFQLKELASEVLRNVNTSAVQSAVNQNAVQIVNAEILEKKEALDEEILNQGGVKAVVGGPY